MRQPAVCSKCGHELPVDAPRGLCPACLLGMAFQVQSPKIFLTAVSSVASPTKIQLTVTQGPHSGQVFEFRAHDTFMVGRSKDAQFRLPIRDKTLSRFHFMIELNPPFCRLMDMASSNGTLVNGKRVTVTDLKGGDVIKAGKTLIQVALLADDPGEQAVEPSAGALAETMRIAPGPLLVPEYQIESELGRGGMGVVYLARTLAGTQPVALKTIVPKAEGSSSTLARFLREASLLRRLNHPNIVRFHALGHTQGMLYFVMEYVPGIDVAALVSAEGGVLPTGRAVHLTCQLLEALSYTHALGVVHRDIKPSNLLVTTGSGGKPVLKVCDFGLSRLYLESSLSGLTMAGQVGGTYGFMPPEQITNFRQAQPSADQYSSAASLYYMLTGRFPFDLPTRVEHQLLMILRNDPVPIQTRRPEIPDALAALIHRALARDPDARFPDVDALHASLTPFRGTA